jgi:polar amino acid transport system permease protein
MNLYITLAASVLILVLSLAIALMRIVPGPAGRPIRLLAIAYVDFFRAIPTIIVLYLVGFGLPLTKLPLISDLDGIWYAIIALSLSFSAYVSELFRSAIESIHASQIAAARSLGLTGIQAYRHVVLPQAIRRVIPPLLGFFIALQKDSALVLILGLMDVFGQARYFSANFFNLSPVSLVGILFLVVTIPQTRLVDHLVARQRQRGGA